MAYPFSPRTHLPPLFSNVSCYAPFSNTESLSSPSRTLGFSKLKRVIQTFIHSYLLRIPHTFTMAKTLVFQAIKNIHVIHFIDFSMKKNKDKNKTVLGSFRLHIGLQEPTPVVEGLIFSDVSSFNSTLFFTDSCDDEIMADDEDARLSGYLHWLEGNEIDTLAEMFIAETHMKFKVEKEESYRRFQEMLARSV